MREFCGQVFRLARSAGEKPCRGCGAFPPGFNPAVAYAASRLEAGTDAHGPAEGGGFSPHFPIKPLRGTRRTSFFLYAHLCMLLQAFLDFFTDGALSRDAPALKCRR